MLDKAVPVYHHQICYPHTASKVKKWYPGTNRTQVPTVPGYRWYPGTDCGTRVPCHPRSYQEKKKFTLDCKLHCSTRSRKKRRLPCDVNSGRVPGYQTRGQFTCELGCKPPDSHLLATMLYSYQVPVYHHTQESTVHGYHWYPGTVM
jgi:hypothetical protein